MRNLNFFTGVMPLEDGYFTTKIGTKIHHAYTELDINGNEYNVFKIKVYLKQKMNVDKITLHLANPVQIANFDNVDGVTTDYSYFNHENSEIEINNIVRYATVTELRNALHTYKANTHDAWCNVRNFEGTGGRQTVQLNYCHHYRGMRHDEFSAGMPDQTQRVFQLGKVHMHTFQTLIFGFLQTVTNKFLIILEFHQKQIQLKRLIHILVLIFQVQILCVYQVKVKLVLVLIYQVKLKL